MREEPEDADYPDHASPPRAASGGAVISGAAADAGSCEQFGSAEHLHREEPQLVLENGNGQRAIVPVSWPAARHWRQVGVTGGVSECSEFVDRTWVDMRPVDHDGKAES